MRIETADYTLTLKRVGALVEVTGDADSLDLFTSGVVLTGAQESSGVEVLDVPVQGLEGRLRVAEGTVALWLSSEVFHYL